MNVIIKWVPKTNFQITSAIIICVFLSPNLLKHLWFLSMGTLGVVIIFIHMNFVLIYFAFLGGGGGAVVEMRRIRLHVYTYF